MSAERLIATKSRKIFNISTPTSLEPRQRNGVMVPLPETLERRSVKNLRLGGNLIAKKIRQINLLEASAAPPKSQKPATAAERKFVKSRPTRGRSRVVTK